MTTQFSRRAFASLLTTGTLVNQAKASTQKATPSTIPPTTTPSHIVRFGIIADVHMGTGPDAVRALHSYIDTMNAKKPDFIVSLGDFSLKPNTAQAMSIWRESTMPRYHVLGNHDMDLGVSKETARQSFGMPSMYYSFDAGPIKGIVLDGNVRSGAYSYSGYAIEIGPAQLDWLDKEIAASDKPVALFIHQPFFKTIFPSLKDTDKVLNMLKKHTSKVFGIFSGHEHADGMEMVDGIPHITIPSSTYFWIRDPHSINEAHTEEEKKLLPSSWKSMVFYREPIWAIVEIDTIKKTLSVHGESSAWSGYAPKACGTIPPSAPHDTVQPYASNRYLTIPQS